MIRPENENTVPVTKLDLNKSSQINLVHSSFAHPLNPTRSTSLIFEIFRNRLLFSTIDDGLGNVRFSSLLRMPGFPKSLLE